jgi:hypothetical protein
MFLTAMPGGPMPEYFDVDGVVKEKGDECTLCYKKFTLIGNKRTNCKKCGICVCAKCRLNKCQLATKDEQLYKVCNKCFALQENQPLVNFYYELLDAKRIQIDVLCTRKKDYKEKIREAQDEAAKLKTQRRDQAEKDEAEIRELDEKLQRKHEEWKRLKANTKNLDEFLKSEEYSMKEKQIEINALSRDYSNLKI